MPIVHKIEYTPAQMRRFADDLECSLQLCDTEEDLNTWQNEGDFTVFDNNPKWIEYFNQLVNERRAMILTTEGENTYANSSAE